MNQGPRKREALNTHFTALLQNRTKKKQKNPSISKAQTITNTLSTSKNKPPRNKVPKKGCRHRGVKTGVPPGR